MPHITLDLISLDGKPLNGLSRRFEGEGGTIGRDEGNTLSLPDSHRRVSRLHAAVSFPGGVPTITNSSAVLPISVGGLQLEGGQAVPLLPGMQLEIGPYVLRVRAAEAVAQVAPAPAATPAGAPTYAPAPAAAPTAPWSPPPGAAVANMDSLFGTPTGMPATPGIQSLVGAPAAFASAPVHAPVAAPVRPPTRGDPFADLLSGLGPAAPAPSTPPLVTAHPVDDPLAGLLGPGTPSYGAPVAPAAADPFAGLGRAPAASPNEHPAFPASPVTAHQPPAVDPGALSDPFAALGLGPAPTSPGGLPATGLLPPSPPPAAALIPEDFNPFELPSAAARNTADPLSSLMLDPAAPPPGHALAGGEQSIDVLFGSTGASHALVIKGGPGSDFLGGPAGGSLLEPMENSNPMALFGDAPGQDPLSRPMRDDLAEIGGAYEPPRPLDPAFAFGAPQAPPAPPMAPPSVAPTPYPFGAGQPGQAPAAPMPSYPADELTRAFLAGANLQPSALPQGLTPEVMTVVGSLLHSATAGAIGMLAIRANIKREVQANVTIISSEANNPLKFLPDADTVLQQLLGKKIPGFMGPDEAMRDAFNDLRAHEAGVIAGTRAALGEVLGKFDPAVLGERLVGGSLLERALPAVRKTKLWDLYLERYAHIRREAEDDFQSIFGRAFVEAYEQETARMKRASYR